MSWLAVTDFMKIIVDTPLESYSVGFMYIFILKGLAKILPIDLAILQKMLDLVLILFIFIDEVQSSGVR